MEKFLNSGRAKFSQFFNSQRSIFDPGDPVFDNQTTLVEKLNINVNKLKYNTVNNL